MKKRVFLLLLYAIPLSVGAQQWFTQNPVWINYFSYGFAGSGSEILSVAGDTTLIGLSAIKIKRVRTYNNGRQSDIRVIRQTGDTVWIWSNNDGAFIRMYDFSLPVGAVLNIPYYYGTKKYAYKIDSVGTMTIAGQPLRVQYLSSDAGPCGKAKVIEKIGAVSFGCRQHFFIDEPDESYVDGPSRILCSYQSEGLSYTDHGSFCQAVALNEFAQATAPLVSPNPGDGLLRVVSDARDWVDSLWRLFDVSGRSMLEGVLAQDAQIDIQSIPAGIYILYWRHKDGRVVATKVVKR